MAKGIDKNINNPAMQEEYAHDKKLMMRYATMKAKKDREAPLTEEVIDDIFKTIIAIGAAIETGGLALIVAMQQLVHMAMKYGPIVWDMYNNYRERQRRKEKQKGGKTALPTEKGLKKILEEHENSKLSVKQNKQGRTAG